jgi:hypothetical protein
MVQWGGYGFDFNEPLHLGAGMVFSDGAPPRTDYPLKKFNWTFHHSFPKLIGQF